MALEARAISSIQRTQRCGQPRRRAQVIKTSSARVRQRVGSNLSMLRTDGAPERGRPPRTAHRRRRQIPSPRLGRWRSFQKARRSSDARAARWLASRVADPLGTRPRSRGAVRPRGRGERRWDIPTATRRPLLSMFYVSRSSRGVGDDALLRHITPRGLEVEGKRTAAALRSEATTRRCLRSERCRGALPFFFEVMRRNVS